jgi:1,4-alpha-glucan branching enzyme
VSRGAAGERGAMAIVLHTHMPYVEGFGTWPFGEEWLWEAMAGSYLPLLDLLDEGAQLTLSLTPVLCDQLQAAGAMQRFERFVGEVRRHTHEHDAAGLRAAGEHGMASELERAYGDYERALSGLRRRGGDLVAAFAPHAQWTSAATHAVLPLLATDATVRAQVRAGVRSHRRRFGGGWRGGFWLPECAFAPWLEQTLLAEGASAVCVELTARLGLGATAHLRPLRSAAGLVLVPIDRATISLVWSDGGYPAAGAYRDYHHHTVHHHNAWANDGSVYDHARAGALAREHAADFVARVRARLRRAAELDRGAPLVVCALDTELLGHWWYEGVQWLGAVVQECEAQHVSLLRLDDALDRGQTAPADPLGEGWQPSTWGAAGDLSTWSGPAVAELAGAARAAELHLLREHPVPAAALRELMALQASDWAFMISRGLAGPYPRARFEGHREALASILEHGEDAQALVQLRALARDAEPASLQAP